MTDQQALLILCAETVARILKLIPPRSGTLHPPAGVVAWHDELNQAIEEAKIEIDAEDYAAS